MDETCRPRRAGRRPPEREGGDATSGDAPSARLAGPRPLGLVALVHSRVLVLRTRRRGHPRDRSGDRLMDRRAFVAAVAAVLAVPLAGRAPPTTVPKANGR